MSKFFTTELAEFHDLEFITVKNNALKKRADITVFNPSKDNKEAKSLPLVILLHGVNASHWAWALKGKVHETAKSLIADKKIKPMVLVMPSDGHFGDGSCYLPHKTENYEEWIAEDVIQVVKEQVPQVDNDSPIFIAGLSMGGFGAMRIGAKYPKTFKAFSGHSSITHFNQIWQFVYDFETLKNQVVEHDGVLDWMIKNKESLPPFRFDCGLCDSLLQHNRKLHQELKNHDIPHVYEEFEGGHTWNYWAKHIEDTLLFFNSYL